jgi:hypothetical protein
LSGSQSAFSWVKFPATKPNRFGAPFGQQAWVMSVPPVVVGMLVVPGGGPELGGGAPEVVSVGRASVVSVVPKVVRLLPGSRELGKVVVGGSLVKEPALVEEVAAGSPPRSPPTRAPPSFWVGWPMEP